MINILDVMNILVGVMSILVLALLVGWMHASRKDVERVKTIHLLRERVDQLEWDQKFNRRNNALEKTHPREGEDS